MGFKRKRWQSWFLGSLLVVVLSIDAVMYYTDSMSFETYSNHVLRSKLLLIISLWIFKQKHVRKIIMTITLLYIKSEYPLFFKLRFTFHCHDTMLWTIDIDCILGEMWSRRKSFSQMFCHTLFSHAYCHLTYPHSMLMWTIINNPQHICLYSSLGSIMASYRGAATSWGFT